MKREPPPNLAFQISATHLCHVLRINTPRLSELTERGIIRRGTDEQGRSITGGYRFDTALNDYHDYLLAEARGQGRNAFEAARARMAAVKAEIASMKLAAMQGEFVDANEAAEIFRSVAMRIRSKLTSVLPRLTRAIYNAGSLEEAHVQAQKYFEEVLAELGRLRGNDLTSGTKLKVIDGRDRNNQEGAGD
jgi:phage terminase Nu1 subunit (DNA packaging protein)